jgi:peptidyl-prolyl cis-trans isomerase-like protein 2
VCTPSGTIFDIKHIIPWLKKHGTNPVNGEKLDGRTLTTLKFDKNEEGEYVDPVTKKVFTDFSKLVAIKTSGRVFLWDTVDQLNLKAKNMRDLVSDEEFTRADLIILQDPMDLEKQNISEFKNLQEDQSASPAPADGISICRLSLTEDKIAKAKAAVAKLRAKDAVIASAAGTPHVAPISSTPSAKKALPYNAAVYNTGKSAASFTSTALDVVTSAERALISEEDYMLVVKRIKIKGYASIDTNFGKINVELYTDYAPKAVYNFVKLCQQGYYNNTIFHRNVRNFMVIRILFTLTLRFKEGTRRGQDEEATVIGRRSSLMKSTQSTNTTPEAC